MEDGKDQEACLACADWVGVRCCLQKDKDEEQTPRESDLSPYL